MLYRQLLVPVTWAVSLVACESAAPIVEGPTIAADSVTTVARVVNVNTLPDAWGTGLYVVQTPTGPLVGGDNGLFALNEEGLESLDPTPVRGLTLYNGEIFAARDDGLFVWEDNAYAASPITDALPELAVNAVATQGDRLWLGTEAGMVAYTSELMTSFSEVAPVHTVSAANGAEYVVFTGGDSAGLFALASEGEEWTVLDFGNDPVEIVMPGSGLTLYGLIGDQLVARVEDESGFVWRGVALEEGVDAPAAAGVSALASNPNTATVWAVTDHHFIEIADTHRTWVPREGVSLNEFTVDTNDTLWASDGSTLSELPGAATSAVTWDQHIEPFATANCNRCHGELSTATELYTSTHWRTAIDEITEHLENGTMPADGTALVDGDVDLIQAWKEGGLQ